METLKAFAEPRHIPQISITYKHTRIKQNQIRTQQDDTEVAVSPSQHPVTLKQGQGHQTCYKHVEINEDDTRTKFEKPLFNCLCPGKPLYSFYLVNTITTTTPKKSITCLE